MSFLAGDRLRLIQSRVSGGGYAANGASLLDEADFTAKNLNDAGKGAASGEVMIHELVHQGGGLGNMFDPSDASGAWSAEGLTVYTTYRIVKELYGGGVRAGALCEKWQEAVTIMSRTFMSAIRNTWRCCPRKNGWRSPIV